MGDEAHPGLTTSLVCSVVVGARGSTPRGGRPYRRRGASMCARVPTAMLPNDTRGGEQPWAYIGTPLRIYPIRA